NIMSQIDKFRRLYEEDLAALEEKEENLDDDGELKVTIIDDYIERFSANIMSVLKLPQLIESAELYFKDFLSVYSPISNDNEFLSWIISHNIKQQIPNPFRLHIYWWSNFEIALIELQLSRLCPTVIEEMYKLEFEKSKDLNFEQYLLDQISKVMIEKLCKIDINDTNQLLIWQRDTTYILSLSSKLPLPISFDNPAINKLQIYNDLSKSLKLKKLIEIRNLEKNEEILSQRFVDIVFEKLYELQQTEDNFSLQRSFINCCLNSLSIESPIRLQYKRAELAVAKMSSCGDCKDLDALLEDILDETKENLINLRISFAGINIMKLYIIRAKREWNQFETMLAQKIKTYFDETQIPQFYKQPLLGFLSNKHALCKLVTDDDNKKIFMSSVIAHIVALHISVPQNSSPLATYMQELQTCHDYFILACPSDELTVITNAIIDEEYNGITRYQCKCGEIYFVGEAGRASHIAQCSACRGEIGGNELVEGNTRLDSRKITQKIDAKDQHGYIVEEKNTENFYSIRSMSPASYRIIHLFVHAIIGIQAPSEVVSKFIKHNVKENNTNLNGAEDMAPFCAMHINNDWNALKVILACGDEQLALVLHAILSEMTQQPLQQPVRLNTPIERETWENQFSQKYVLPLVKNVIGTATDFSMLLETITTNAQQKTKAEEIFSRYMTILSEINSLIPQEHIPEDKKAIFVETYSINENYREGSSVVALENLKELLSALEIILCFLKRTSGSNRDTLITEYIESWMKLEKLNNSLQHDILNAVDFESLEQGEQFQDAKSNKNLRIPAKAFAIALKRFITRYLTTSESIIDVENLIYYLVEEESLKCWPDWVDKAVIKNKFPSSLRISHTFEAYQFIKETIE
ncbi:26806_t:CDS:2, partial [Dentiscutata erythropus]